MHYNVAQLLKEPTGAQREYSVAEAFAGGGLANGGETGTGGIANGIGTGTVGIANGSGSGTGPGGIANGNGGETETGGIANANDTGTAGSVTGGAPPGEYASGAVRLVRTHQGIWARASLRLRLAQDCSRCLDGFDTTLALEVEEEYFPEVDVRTGRRIAPPDDWEGLYIGADHILNLGEAAYQSALAALPMKPLCQPDCAGICHSCGADRNRNRCDCDTAPVDPRWSALRALIAEG